MLSEADVYLALSSKRSISPAISCPCHYGKISHVISKLENSKTARLKPFSRNAKMIEINDSKPVLAENNEMRNNKRGVDMVESYADMIENEKISKKANVSNGLHVIPMEIEEKTEVVESFAELVEKYRKLLQPFHRFLHENKDKEYLGVLPPLFANGIEVLGDLLSAASYHNTSNLYETVVKCVLLSLHETLDKPFLIHEYVESEQPFVVPNTTLSPSIILSILTALFKRNISSKIVQILFYSLYLRILLTLQRSPVRTLTSSLVESAKKFPSELMNVFKVCLSMPSVPSSFTFLSNLIIAVFREEFSPELKLEFFSRILQASPCASFSGACINAIYNLVYPCESILTSNFIVWNESLFLFMHQYMTMSKRVGNTNVQTTFNFTSDLFSVLLSRCMEFSSTFSTSTNFARFVLCVLTKYGTFVRLNSKKWWQVVKEIKVSIISDSLESAMKSIESE